VEIKLNCSFEVREGALAPILGRPSTLIGIPFDRPVVGYGGKTINTLRLWAAAATNEFDFQAFSHGAFVGALASTLAAESVTRVLYPDDSTSMGQGLRFVQEYFLVACAIADLVRRFRHANADWDALPAKVAVQLNDTHPALAVPELMRVLVDDARLGWDRAWDLTRRTLAYTNHTLLPEALEKWPLGWFETMLPRHLEIIFEINRRLLDEARRRFPADDGRIARVSLVEEGAEKKIRMANVAVVGSHSTNGVAAIHSALLRATTMKDLAELYPERFSNKTNGVTPRRWLLLANPALAGTITDAIGPEWITDLGQLARLKPLADDRRFRCAFLRAKHSAKRVFADWLRSRTGQMVDPYTIFDSQVKRIHEYKRQLLNALRILVLYNRQRANPTLAVVPRTFFFAGKAAPAYHLAKLIIKLLNNLAARHRCRFHGPRPAQRGVPRRLRRVPRRAADSGHGHLEPDLHRGVRGERHQQHEVHDEWGVDRRHARRRDGRNGAGGRRGQLLPLRADGRAGRRPSRLVRSALALRARA
jgi:starch phosphorylase